MSKVRETRHQNPEFGHTQGEIHKKKNLQDTTERGDRGWKEAQKGYEIPKGDLGNYKKSLLNDLMKQFLRGHLKKETSLSSYQKLT
jgi:hypothetical protein